MLDPVGVRPAGDIAVGQFEDLAAPFGVQAVDVAAAGVGRDLRHVAAGVGPLFHQADRVRGLREVVELDDLHTAGRLPGQREQVCARVVGQRVAVLLGVPRGVNTAGLVEPDLQTPDPDIDRGLAAVGPLDQVGPLGDIPVKPLGPS